MYPSEMQVENNPLDGTTENIEIHIDIPECGTNQAPISRLNLINHISYRKEPSPYRTTENGVVQWYAENTERTATVLSGKYTGRPAVFEYRS